MDIRCPACKGAKQVMKLGSIYGPCNTCKGRGVVKEIEPKDKPLLSPEEIEPPKKVFEPPKEAPIKPTKPSKKSKGA
jgi:hypothetical protein